MYGLFPLESTAQAFYRGSQSQDEQLSNLRDYFTPSRHPMRPQLSDFLSAPHRLMVLSIIQPALDCLWRQYIIPERSRGFASFLTYPAPAEYMVNCYLEANKQKSRPRVREADSVCVLREESQK
jgi:hypothetical protein